MGTLLVKKNEYVTVDNDAIHDLKTNAHLPFPTKGLIPYEQEVSLTWLWIMSLFSLFSLLSLFLSFLSPMKKHFWEVFLPTFLTLEALFFDH